MKNIVYYISDHGLGHTTRSIAILRALLNYEEVQLTIKTGNPLSFIKKSLKKYKNVDFAFSENDVGLILKENSFEVDKATLQLKIRGWVQNWHEQISQEALYLEKNEIDAVISDITPWVFPAAARAGVKSIAISNFSWYDQYQELIGRDRSVEIIGDAYQKVDLFLKYPLALNVEKAANVEEIGFLCRKFDSDKINFIKNSELENDKKTIFVGIGKSLSPTILQNIDFQKWKQYNWIFTDEVGIKEDNIYIIPEKELEVQNYIAASDYVLAKPGWGTVVEALLAGVPMLLINLQNIPETRKIIEGIKKRGAGFAWNIKDFYNLTDIEENLEKLDKLNPAAFNYENERIKTAEKIYDFIKS